MYNIRFNHIRHIDFEDARSLVQKSGVHIQNYQDIENVTVCRIYSGGVLIATGYAFNNFNDNFDRRKGRKQALTRALSQIGQKSTRGEVWSDYFARFN